MTLPTVCGFSRICDLLESARVMTSGFRASNGVEGFGMSNVFVGFGGVAGLKGAEEAGEVVGRSGSCAVVVADVGAFLLGARARFLVMCVSWGPEVSSASAVPEVDAPDIPELFEGLEEVGGPLARIPASAGLNLFARPPPAGLVCRRAGAPISFCNGILTSGFGADSFSSSEAVRESAEGVVSATSRLDVDER
jgi:hypothetical protein